MIFEEREADAVDADARLVVDVDGFEGPLDLLLELARRQKVDLGRISMLALTEQFLAFVETAGTRRLERAADYLVMAAWLALLKSRLLLPRAAATEDTPNGEALAAALAERLRCLASIRAAANALDERPRLGRDTALRGVREDAVARSGPVLYAATIFDLVRAYARQRRNREPPSLRLGERQVLSLPDARAALLHLARPAEGWFALDALLQTNRAKSPRTIRASTLAVALEMVREGRLAMRQVGAFAPIEVKAIGPAS